MRWLALLIALLATPASADLFGAAPAVVGRLANPAQVVTTPPSIDGSSGIQISTASTIVLTLTTTQTNDTIVLFTTLNGGNTVSGVSGCGLTWSARTIISSPATVAEWYATSASAQASCSITITFSYAVANIGVAFGVHGNGTVAPSFDTNTSLAAYAGGSPVTYSTNNAADLIFVFYNCSGSATPANPAGFTAITAAAQNSSMTYQTVSTTRSSTSVAGFSTVNLMVADAMKD